MNHPWKRFLSMLLTAALVLALAIPGFAAPEEDGEETDGIRVSWTKVDVRPESRLIEPILPEEQPTHAPEDIVRVAIVLKRPSVLEARYSAKGIAKNMQARRYRDTIRSEQNDVADRIAAKVLHGEALDVVWNLTLAANVISANVPFGAVEKIKALPGVKNVVPETLYEPAADEPAMSFAGGMTGSCLLWSWGCTGAGSIVAVIDTGLDTDHELFQPDALEYALEQDGSEAGLLTAADVEAVWDSLHASAFLEGPDGVYLNSKVPYAVNYIDKDLDITHDNDEQGEHGSHVAGIAAANRYVADGSGGYAESLERVLTQGQAPDAQIIVMKVFGKRGGAYDSDYMVAIEDDILLGADSVNLSLGSAAAGFAASWSYQAFMDSLTECDTVVSVSAGNSYDWTRFTLYDYLYSDDVGYHTGGSPGSYTNSLTVASVNNESRTYSVAAADDPAGQGYGGDFYTMSPFSSWGVPGDLSLKPEIAAPGGYIYSVDGSVPGGQGYETMSGTSMAAPQISGIAALMAQYIRENDLTEKTVLTQRALINSLLMSTARPLLDERSGLYYPVLRQGAGLVDVAAAVNADTYVLMGADATPSWADGKVKAELGDDPGRSGTYTFTFTLNNLTDEEHRYALSADFFTQDVFLYNVNTLDENHSTVLLSDEDGNPMYASYLDQSVVLLDADVSWTANGDPCEPSPDGVCVTVPADGSVEIGVTVTLEDIAKYDDCGAYVEGYVFAAEPAGDDGAVCTRHSIPVLGYYGSWSEPAMHDKGSRLEFAYGMEYREPYMTAALGADSRSMESFTVADNLDPDNPYYLGGNPISLALDDAYYPERNSIAGDSTITGARLSLIRNAAGSLFTVRNADTGEVLAQSEGNGGYAAFFSQGSGSWYNCSQQFPFGYAPAGLEDGTRLELTLKLAPEYYLREDGSIDWDSVSDDSALYLPLVTDSTAPVIDNVVFGMNEAEGAEGLTLEIAENRYVAYASVMTRDALLSGESTTLAVCTSPADAQEGDGLTIFLPHGDGGDGVDFGKAENRSLLVTVCDYAKNFTAYSVDLDTVAPTLEITADLSDYVGSAGSIASFTVQAAGTGLSYQWYVKKPTATKFSKSSITGDTYAVELTEARNGNRLYCVVTDTFGNSARTNTVSMIIAEPLEIIADLADYVGPVGSTASFTAQATGTGLSYQWYVKNRTASRFSRSSVTDATYSVTLTAANSGRQLYCVVTDAYGNKAQTNTVSMTVQAEALNITRQPVDYVGAAGSKASFTVEAEGEGLSYQWYVKNPGSSRFSKSSITKASYSVTLTEANSGRQLYCVVSDAYGNKAQTNTVSMTLKAAPFGAPVLKSATAGADGITVTWGAVSGATAYRVYRKTASGGWTGLKDVSGTSCTDASVTGGTTYTYTVKAWNGSTWSGFDAKGVSATAQEAPAPFGAPALKSATAGADGITVTWGAVSGATAYRVYRRIGSGGWEGLKDVTGTTYTDSAVTSGTTYTYTVKAYNGSTWSGFDANGITAAAK